MRRGSVDNGSMAFLPGFEQPLSGPGPVPDGPRRLVLARALVSLDLETTGLDLGQDRIVEISCVTLRPDGSRAVLTRRVNPQMPIPEQATAVHGITDQDVAGAPTFAQLAPSLHRELSGVDLTGFNLERFDLPILAREFEAVGLSFPEPSVKIVDPLRIFLSKEPRDLAAAYRFYCGKELVGAHSAEADAQASAEILLAQIERYDDLPDRIDLLHDFCHRGRPDWVDADGKLLWRHGKAVMGFGKFKHRSLEEMATNQRAYLEWMATADFSPEVRGAVREALAGKFPTPPQDAGLIGEQGAPVRSGSMDGLSSRR